MERGGWPRRGWPSGLCIHQSTGWRYEPERHKACRSLIKRDEGRQALDPPLPLRPAGYVHDDAEMPLCRGAHHLDGLRVDLELQTVSVDVAARVLRDP